MEIFLSSVLAVFISGGVAIRSKFKTDQQLAELQERIEKIESDTGAETTRKMVGVMMPVVQAVKHLQDTVGVR